VVVGEYCDRVREREREREREGEGENNFCLFTIYVNSGDYKRWLKKLS